MKENEKYYTSEGFKARIATIEDVRESFKEGYTGKAICILWNDESDSMIHDNGYSLEDCEKAYANGGSFFFDENLFVVEEKAPIKILIIEDNDRKFEDVACMVAKSYNCTIERAKSRNSGLYKIRESYENNDPYSLLICDNYLPVYENGQDIKPRATEIINHIRHRGYNLPICLCSSEKVDDVQVDYVLHYDPSVYLGNQIIEMLTKIIGETAITK